MNRKYLHILSYVLVAAIASSISFGIAAMSRRPSKLDRLEALIEACFIGETDRTAIEDAAANAMVDALGDRWSYYIPASEYADYSERMDNAYVGIGITIRQAEDASGFVIESVTRDTPAYEGDLRVNDVIVNIEGQSCQGMTVIQARDLVRGEVGTTVSLTILRQEETINVNLPRRQIETMVARWELLDTRVGLVTIDNFDSRCASETIAAIDAVLGEGAEMLIFDVRNNPGGYASELVTILDYLLPEGELFRTVDYRGREQVDMSDESCLNVPMAVLVNGESYSAAEFFAAALMEYEVAVVVGERTSGKGYFQTTFHLPDGSAVGLSVGKYFTPKGNSLAEVGIQPDINVPVEDEIAYGIYYGLIPPVEDPQIQAAFQYLLSKSN